MIVLENLLHHNRNCLSPFECSIHSQSPTNSNKDKQYSNNTRPKKTKLQYRTVILVSLPPKHGLF